MQQYQFVYDTLRLSKDRRTVGFDYIVKHGQQEYRLTETLEFPVALPDTPEQRRSLRALHLALGVSYYKIFLAPKIIHPYAMDGAEAKFWNNTWRGGLGEFLYVNKLPAERLALFSAQDGENLEGETPAESNGAILGIGGGKDSVVAGELLKHLGVPLGGFVIATGEQLGQAGSVASTMGVELHAVKRTIDKQLIELQEQPDAYKGHIPVSLIFALVGTALAVASNKEYVIVANEASASIPRGASWEGKAVNHQWSKSLEAERQTQAFIQRSITPKITYFSTIRQLTSVGVAKIFANFSQYFEVFTSDNFVFRIDPARRPNGRWGLESPKSLSSYILLAPWLSDDDVKRVFTLDFLNEPSLKTMFLEMTGFEGEPPLDCVGTPEELELSINLLAQQGRYQDTALMNLAKERGIVRDGGWRQELQRMLELQPDEALPRPLQEQVQDYLQERLK
jgi:hypothetical protein